MFANVAKSDNELKTSLNDFSLAFYSPDAWHAERCARQTHGPRRQRAAVIRSTNYMSSLIQHLY